LGTTEIGQLLNIAQLLNHYKQHHDADHQLCFADFLVMHYCTDDGTDTDNEQDNKLPFKQIHSCNFIFYTAQAEQPLTQQYFCNETIEKNSHFTCQDTEPVYLNIPIQPPRFS
jgi:hypothetical protein